MSPDSGRYVERADPARKSFAIVQSDTNDLAQQTRSLWVGSAGNIKLMLVGDTEPQIMYNVQDGSWLPIEVKRVYAQGAGSTTAQNLLGFS